MKPEAIQSSDNVGTSTSLVVSDDSVKDEEPETIDISKLLVVPVVKARGIPNWTNVLAHHEKRLLDTAQKLQKLTPYADLVDQIISIKEMKRIKHIIPR